LGLWSLIFPSERRAFELEAVLFQTALPSHSWPWIKQKEEQVRATSSAFQVNSRCKFSVFMHGRDLLRGYGLQIQPLTFIEGSG